MEALCRSPLRALAAGGRRWASGPRPCRPGGARSVAAAAGASTDAAGSLADWVTAGGGSAAGVAVTREPGGLGFGLVAAEDCSAGAELVRLPPSLQLSYSEAGGDPRLLALIARVPQELWGAKLALQLLACRLQGGASGFDPYVRALPAAIPGLPIFFPGPALGLLEYPPVTEQVKMRCRWLLSFAKEVLEPVRGTEADPFGGAAVDANALGWALGAVTSRAFRVRGASHPAALLPLIDMANHSFQPNAKVELGGAGAVRLLAAAPLRAGEPLRLNYGNLSSDFLLLDYGFAVHSNPYDSVQLRFDPGLIEAARSLVAGGGGAAAAASGGAPLAHWRQRALEGLGLAGPGANLEVSILRPPAPGGAPVEGRLLGAARALCAGSERELAGRSADRLADWGAPLPPESEASSLRALSGLCAIALSQFSGTLQDDEAALGSADPAAAAGAAGVARGDAELALRFRIGKKRLLLEALGVLSARLTEIGDEGGNRPPAPSGSKVPSSKQGGKGFGK